MKKVMALFLAMLLCMALAVSAMADGVSIASGGDISSGGHVLQYDTKLQEPVIKVTVPPAAQTLVLNPYNINVKTGSTSISGDTTFGTSVGSGKDSSVLAAKLYLKNESNVPVKVSLKATGDIPNGSTATFSPVALTDKETNKKVFMFVQVGTTMQSGDSMPAAAISDLVAASYVKGKNQGVIQSGDTVLTNVLTMKTPDSMGATFNYTTIEVGGNCTTTPTEQWLPTDLVTLKLVFTFQATNNSAANNA